MRRLVHTANFRSASSRWKTLLTTVCSCKDDMQCEISPSHQSALSTKKAFTGRVSRTGVGVWNSPSPLGVSLQFKKPFLKSFLLLKKYEISIVSYLRCFYYLKSIYGSSGVLLLRTWKSSRSLYVQSTPSVLSEESSPERQYS